MSSEPFLTKLPNQVEDVAGRQFGKLTVLSFSHCDKGALWHCRCECGTEKLVKTSAMKSGGTKSCGCIRRENTLERARSTGFEAQWRRAVYAYVNNAKQRGITWDLTPEEALKIMRANCVYCGTEPSNDMFASARKTFGIKYNGIDRIENDLGYVPGNVTTCCKTCNLAKRSMNVTEFIAWANKVANYNHLTEVVISTELSE